MRKVNRKMKPEKKAIVLKALRSGEYKRTTGRLHKGGKFCIYGVMCDVSSIGEWEEVDGYTELWYNIEGSERAYSESMPVDVRKDFFTEIESIEDSYKQSETIPVECIIETLGYDCAREKMGDSLDYTQWKWSLMELNDHGFTFEELAQIIEDWL